MKTKIFVTGVILGFLAMGAVVWIAMPRMMINVYKSPYGFDETVAAVEAALAGQEGWKVAKTFDIQKNIVDAGHTDLVSIYGLTAAEFEACGFGPKQAENLVAELLRSRTDADVKTTMSEKICSVSPQCSAALQPPM